MARGDPARLIVEPVSRYHCVLRENRMKKAKILIVEDNELSRQNLSELMLSSGYDVKAVEDGREAMTAFLEDHYDITVTDLKMPHVDGLELLRFAKEMNPDHVVIIITGYGTVSNAVEAMKLGAFDFIAKPLKDDLVKITVQRAVSYAQLKAENIHLRDHLKEKYDLGKLLGYSDCMKKVFGTIEKVADSDSTVLIYGESGTGKELVAKAIHYNSPYRDEPFIVINCSAIQDTLLESELFGHVKGAFTDAVSETKGKFEIAGKGTLFLDEIGDVSPNLQSKLLRVLESRDFMKVGGEKVLKTEARIIAATNQSLKALIEKGRFREDLFYRLKVVEIALPALRERREDIPDLVAYLLEKINRELRRNVRKVPPEVMKTLAEMPWRGNVRELENALTRAVILAKGDVVLKENLPVEPDEGRTFPDELVSLEEVEKRYVQHVLDAVKGSKTRASQVLGISRPTLDKKIKEYGLDLGDTP